MYKVCLVLLLIFQLKNAFAQTTIAGKVTNAQGQPMPGTNIFLKDTYDGTSTGADGIFSFKTQEKGNHILMVSFLGYKKQEISLLLPYQGNILNIVLEEEFNKLDAVTINAGAFEASDEKKGVLLKPLDIVTTAGATGDIAGALNTLPGTQKVGESGRLFVRGGESHETRTFVDGLLVQNPYNATAGNLPSRNRFSPFLFKGTLFSTGGYSAEYSGALSSALILNTTDFPTESKTDLSFMTVGGGIAHTESGSTHSFTGELSYFNLLPYFHLVKQNVAWNKAPQAISGSIVYRYKLSKTGLLKVYGTISKATMGMHQSDAITLSRQVSTAVDNRFAYVNTSYRDIIGKKWSFFAGAAYNISQDSYAIDTDNIGKTEKSLHLKNTFTLDWTERVVLHMGYEGFINHTRFSYRSADESLQQQVDDNLVGAFTETDIYLSKKITARAGLRLDYSSLQAQHFLAPRLSFAYQSGENSQVSLAYGQFSQQPLNDWLRYAPTLGFEKADHYILQYQRIKNERTLRAELYHKQYDHLVSYKGIAPMQIYSLTNSGNGFANGFDLFLRDKKSIKNADYWISYSFLNTRRRYLDFPQKAIPTFASAHNISWVYKQFVSGLRTQLGTSVSYSSPRPYHNPNRDGFNACRTPAYWDVSANAAFLYRQHIIFYVSATNLLGRDNIFGYRTALQADVDGSYKQETIQQGASRFIFLGIFITFSQNKTDNQLDNL